MTRSIQRGIPMGLLAWTAAWLAVGAGCIGSGNGADGRAGNSGSGDASARSAGDAGQNATGGAGAERSGGTSRTGDQFAEGAAQPADGGSGSGGAAPEGRASDKLRAFPLDSLRVATVTIGSNAFRVWLAVTPEQAQEGLMFVPQEEIADDQGMLFVFEDDDYRSFWMKNTVTPLDIAFIRSDGTIVKTHTMPRLTLQSFPSIHPARLALEVKAGTFARLGIREGDRVDIPREVFETSP